MKIYVASSWRNPKQPATVVALREAGHEVYDFRNPPSGTTGFSWSAIDPEWKDWDPEAFRGHLEHPLAREGYADDKEGMDWAQVCVLLMPCGRSAHLEAGYMAGEGKPTYVILSDGEPELMYLLLDYICVDLDEAIWKLDEFVDPFKPGDKVSVGSIRSFETPWTGEVIAVWWKQDVAFANIQPDVPTRTARGFPTIACNRLTLLDG